MVDYSTGPDWDQYRRDCLDHRPLAEAIAVADDELALYHLYQRTNGRAAAPTMGHPYAQKYRELTTWFHQNFEVLLLERTRQVDRSAPGIEDEVAEIVSPVQIANGGRATPQSASAR